ncbi:unnamed protein product [Owenia fusiformis]|uniref:Uncharacterized protein n=1 Tax=Owenia fusiformis TaxID=6347 RepID=A0A8S4Q1P0_OWEFU|nr:unnamed protein product [Owenia fusiformis]
MYALLWPSHSSPCQIMWGGDWKKGAWTTSNACKPSKYMGCARREEVITRLVSFWGRKKVKSLQEYLTRRYRKVRKWLLRLKKTLPMFIGICYSVELLICSFISFFTFSRFYKYRNRNGVSPEVEYFQLRKQEDVFNALNNGQPDPITRIVTGTVDLHLSLESGQLGCLNFSETSKECHKLRRANQKTKKAIEKAVEIYNIAAQDIENEVQINSTEMGCILKADFPWRSDITLGKKRDLVNKKESFERLKEEEVLLKKEMKQFLLYYKSKDTNGNVGMEMDVNNINDATYMKGLVGLPFFNDEAYA